MLAKDAEAYGIASPDMIILVYGAESEQPLAQYTIGDIAPDTFSRYVQAAGRDESRHHPQLPDHQPAGPDRLGDGAIGRDELNLANTTTPVPVMVSWSSGKDSAWALHTLRQQPERYEVRGIFTTVTTTFDRISIHSTPRWVLKLQSERLGLPLYEIAIPSPCTNAQYEAAHAGVSGTGCRHCPGHQTASHLAFGDLFLEDIRRYREDNLSGTGFSPLFPVWGNDTSQLAESMIASGVHAIIHRR